jgi:hypothetical protein
MILKKYGSGPTLDKIRQAWMSLERDIHQIKNLSEQINKIYYLMNSIGKDLKDKIENIDYLNKLKIIYHKIYRIENMEQDQL